MKITTREICEIVKGDLVGDPDVIIEGPSKIQEAKKGTISFLANPKYKDFVYSTEASAILVSKDFIPHKDIKTTLIKVDNVYSSLGVLLNSFENTNGYKGISDTAIIKTQLKIPKDVYIGDLSFIAEDVEIGPNSYISSQSYIGKGVKIGSNTKIYPGVRIYHDCIIGDHVVIHANSVVGSDGFGFVPNKKGVYEKIPQIGNVIIENHVEIGAGSVIDRATMGSTIIRSGVKLDNLVQVAHNVEIGEHTVIAAQCGIAGSTKIGKFCVFGGQVGIAGHLNIPDGTQIQGQSGVISNPAKEKSKLYGSPALEYGPFLRSYAHFKNFPSIVKEINDLKREIKDLKSKI